MEWALLQGEQESEVIQLQQEQKIVQQLQEKLCELDSSIQKERDKVNPRAESSPVCALEQWVQGAPPETPQGAAESQVSSLLESVVPAHILLAPMPKRLTYLVIC